MPPLAISVISESIIQALNLNIESNTPIFLGESNITHMKNKHPNDYQAYSKYIADILNNPDYVGINRSDQSIEYIKTIYLKDEGKFVKVAVRVANSGKYYARSLYTLNSNRVKNFIQKGYLIKP